MPESIILPPARPIESPASPPIPFAGLDLASYSKLEQRLQEAEAEKDRLRAVAAAVADANALASDLMVELEEAKQSLESKNRDLQAQAAMLAEAIEKGRAADIAKNHFLAAISHEIRTPLHGILGMTDLVLGTRLDAEQHEMVSTVRSCSDFLLQLINDVLDFSKLQDQKLVLDPVAFDLRDTLFDCVRAVAVQGQKKGLDIICDIAPEIPTRLIGDAARLHQVVLNLLSNAVKFTSEGEVSLRVERSSTEAGPGTVDLLITVRDTGIGIAKDHQRLVFEPFVQAEASINRRYGGTGLGLSICQRIAALMGGRIWVESEPGEGSRFHFSVAFAAGESREVPKEPANTLRGLRVLLVDRNAAGRRALGRIMEYQGMQVAVANGLETALNLAEGWTDNPVADFVILDSCTVEGYAEDLLSGLRQRNGGTAAHMIVLTCAGASCASAADGRLMKPVKPSDLLKLMEDLRSRGGRDKRALAQAPPGSPLRILLAEDNPVNQRVASSMLRKRGHSVEIANDGQYALDLHAAAEFDLILMDVQMPRMDGIEATRWIRQREQQSGRHTPVVGLSATCTDEGRRASIEAGMNAYLLKPIRDEQLFETIERIAGAA
jgi:two-component system, sensor histidine kinase and response regulator